jgi:Glycogen recognition site of AMP-activated protein kinase
MPKIWIILFCFFCLPFYALAQKEVLVYSDFGKYFIDKDEIVFEFSQSKYAEALKKEGKKRADFYDLDILTASQSTEYGSWKKQGWRMVYQKIDIYQVRKPIAEIKDAPNWMLRVISDANYWNEPLQQDSIKVADKNLNGKNNARFFLVGYPDAKQVYLAGYFNNWNPEGIKMRKIADGWEYDLSLKPGRYEYKFVIDSNWIHDPANKDSVINEHGTFNSVLHINVPVTFFLPGQLDAKKVLLGCELNNWNKAYEIPLTRTETGWTTTVPMSVGKIIYKFQVDDLWILDPNNKRKETTRDGYVNSVLMVRKSGEY